MLDPPDERILNRSYILSRNKKYTSILPLPVRLWSQSLQVVDTRFPSNFKCDSPSSALKGEESARDHPGFRLNEQHHCSGSGAGRDSCSVRDALGAEFDACCARHR
jgi:hypothetical protein